MVEQVEAIRAAAPDAIISVGAYAACAAFVRDVVNAGWDIPVANLSFVGSESLLELLRAEGQRTGRNYVSRLINSQVVPSYEDQSLASVREFRTLIARHRPRAPFETGPGPERPVLTFVSFEGFLDAKLLTEVLRRSGGDISRTGIRQAFTGIEALDLAIDVPLSFGPARNQGLDTVYFTMVSGDRFVPLNDWRSWAR